MTEIWKPVPGYEGRYEVSDLGRVRSLDRSITQQARSGTVYTKQVRGVLLRPGRCASGHLTVLLGRDGGSHCVHEIVLRTFVGPAPVGCEARHLDGVESNNRLNNLVWDTRGNNSRDKKWHRGQRGYKLTPADISVVKHKLRTRRYRGAQREIAKEHGVSESVISHIKVGRIHVDVEY